METDYSHPNVAFSMTGQWIMSITVKVISNKQQTPLPLFRERTIPTERLSLVDEI
jgi:hypothetical protein